jgi:hypothetical protein
MLAPALEPTSRPGIRSERVLCIALTGIAAGLLLAFGPAPGDAAVHLYRTFLVDHGALLWDNDWYAGQYPLASYSLLYYLPAALVGNVPFVVAAAGLSTLLFASIARREWGDAALWPSRVFGVCAAAPLFTGLYSYSLGVTALLAALRALQARRTGVVALFAALTLGFSPLAFMFLCLLLASIFIARRQLTASIVVLAASLALIAGFEVLVLHLFPTGGFYPFHGVNLAGVLAVSTVGALLARHARQGRVIGAFFVLWGAGSIVAAVVQTPVGDNWTRLNEFAFPLMLLTASLARFRPRWLVTVALAGAFAYNVTPYLLLIPYRLDNRPATERFWQPALTFLEQHSQPGYRVEVVPTAAHWESYWIPHAGLALARGWYRQLDLVDNPILYSKRLDAASYRRWLRSAAVEYVLLPATRLDPDGGPREARLLRSGTTGLVVAYRDTNWTIYELPRATPLITGPGSARVLTFGHTTISGVVSAPGTYLMRNHYMPFWKVTGAVCLRPAAHQMTSLDVAAAGHFTMTVDPDAEAILRAATSDGDDACAPSVERLASR